MEVAMEWQGHRKRFQGQRPILEHMGNAAEEERRKEEGQRSRRRQADLPWIRLAQVLIVFTALCFGVEDSFKGGYQVNIWIQCIGWESSQS